MRPWAHESELASYLEGQRMMRARTPVTPTYPTAQMQHHSEDLSRLEQVTRALQDLRSRLANHEELMTQVDQLLDYLQELRQDFPLQSPEGAFERLQTLRSFVFWLPPAMLKPNEQDIGAIAVLSHYYAVALALEPLFPEIGGSYLGSMSVAPLEKMHSMLLSRRASQGQDNGTQVALSLLEIPMSILTAYRARQRQLAQNLETYRVSPRSPYVMPQMQLSSTPELPPATLYSNSPAQSPGNLCVPGSSHFSPSANSGPTRRDSPTTRPHPKSERSMSAGSPLAGPQVTYPSHSPGEYEMASGIGFHDSLAYHSYGINTRFVTPSQLWA